MRVLGTISIRHYVSTFVVEISTFDLPLVKYIVVVFVSCTQCMFSNETFFIVSLERAIWVLWSLFTRVLNIIQFYNVKCINIQFNHKLRSWTSYLGRGNTVKMKIAYVSSIKSCVKFLEKHYQIRKTNTRHILTFTNFHDLYCIFDEKLEKHKLEKKGR